MFRTALISMFITSAAIADTWTVDDDGKADFDNIQAAVDASSDGDEIVVMPGTYTSTQDGHVVNMLGKAVTLRSSNPSDSDVVAATIIDGQNTRRGLACFNYETAKTIISGFTITNGYGSGFDYNNEGNIDLWEESGGGMCIVYSSPTLTNCTFTNNTAGWKLVERGSTPGGGGMCILYSSNPTLTNCTFTDNTAFLGGGMYNVSNATLENCTFENNTANNRGGGMFNNNGSPTLSDCIFTNNTADDGGGMYNFDSNHPTLENCTLCSNTPDQIHGLWSDEGGNTVSAICPIPGACCTNDGCVVSEEEDCNTFLGQWQGEGTTCEDNPCPTNCLGDLTGDGQVNVNDLLILIAVWGTCP